MRTLMLAAVSVLALAGCGSSGPTYSSPHAIIMRLNAAGIDCPSMARAYDTMYADSAQDCTLSGDRITVATYATGDQLDQAKDYLTGFNPGSVYVWGNGWSVSAPSQQAAARMAAALNS